MHFAMNDEIVRRFGVLSGRVRSKVGVGEMVVDSSEIINTLRGGVSARSGTQSLRDHGNGSKSPMSGIISGIKDTLKKREATEEVLLGEDRTRKSSPW